MAAPRPDLRIEARRRGTRVPPVYRDGLINAKRLQNIL